MLSLTDKEVDMLRTAYELSARPISRKSRFSRQSCLCSYQGAVNQGAQRIRCVKTPKRMIVNQPVEKCVHYIINFR